MVETTDLKKCMLVFVRHGERLDQVGTLPEGSKIDFKFDPPLTAQGMIQASDAAKLTRNFLESKGYRPDV